MCFFEDGLAVTSGHPVLHNGEWVFPRDVKQPQLADISSVYNIVVDRHHIIFVNNVPLILPGHNYTEGVLKHEYLGSQDVINDLKRMPGWDNGFINLIGDLSAKKALPFMEALFPEAPTTNQNELLVA